MLKSNRWWLLVLLVNGGMVQADSPTIYCAQGGGYLKTGMTIAQVRSLCGSPIHVEKKKVTPSYRVPAQKLVYHLGEIQGGLGNTTYSAGTAGAVKLVVNVQNGQVTGISLDGSSTNATTICPGGSFQKGSPVEAVMSACGEPAYVNHSYQTVYPQDVSKRVERQTWLIKFNEYDQNPSSLVFVNGVLESIN